RQLVSGYIEGFLQRERTGPEHLEELVSTLRKLSAGSEAKEAPLLKDSIEALARAAESRDLHGSGHGETVGQYCETLGRPLGLSSEEVRDHGFAGRVDDVGMMFVPVRILNNRGAYYVDAF